MKIVKCAHCNGKGKCNLKCASCASWLNVNSNQIFPAATTIKCLACEGVGQRTLPLGLTLHDSTERNETERTADSRKFKVAIFILIIASLIFACGIALAIWKPGTILGQILFPLGASIISPVAVGYFGQKINITNKTNQG